MIVNRPYFNRRKVCAMGFEFAVVSFYLFVSWDDNRVLEVESALAELAAERDLTGLVIMSSEGINGSISVRESGRIGLQRELQRVLCFPGLEFRVSYAAAHPFRKFSVKKRLEVVTAGVPQFSNQPTPAPASLTNVTRYSPRYLSPSEWHAALTDPGDDIILDVRNRYEFGIGKFRGARMLPIEQFTEFSEAADVALKDLGLRPVDTSAGEGEKSDSRRVLMYCTGGIRCEKAAYQLERLGYREVFQLHGGILSYLEQFSGGHYEGECFVFDNRVAVDANLAPTTRYRFCYGCGEPVLREERRCSNQECREAV